MAKEKETTKIIVKNLKEHRKKILSDLENFQQNIYFIQGVALGLFYGIVGNIFVSHYYQVFEGLILAEFDTLFWPNLIVFIIALVLILLVSTVFYNQLKKFKTRLKIHSKNIEIMNQLIDSYTREEDMEISEA